VPRRILLLITDLEIGGTPTVVRELATRLNDPPGGVEIEVACLSRWGPVAEQIRTAGVAVTALGARSPIDFPSTVWRLIHLIRGGGFDTVFSFLAHANTVAAAASPFCGGVRFIQSIQTTQPRPRWHWRVQRCIQGAAEKVVVPSPSAARVAREWSDVPPAKLVVISNAIEPDDFPRSPIPGKSPRPYPIGFIGRLDPVKRVDRLLADMQSVDRQTRGGVHLHIFGDGIERGNISREIDRLGVEGVVTMHGAVPRPQEALARIGLLVLRSEAEGFGLVLIEAMAAGVPVIGTDVPGICDVIDDGVNGLLADPMSDSAVARAIVRLIDDPSLQNRLIDGGLRTVHEHFSWRVVIPQYRRLLGI
jgi:glycosyltransferase involved in cell wall biosynthesis